MKRHAGFTTFTVTLLLILILMSISLLVGKLMVTDRKISVNEVQYRQALALAELGLADGLGRLAASAAWRTSSSGVSTTVSTGSYTLTALDTSAISAGTVSLMPVELSASAALPDGLGAATVRAQVAGYSLMSDAKTVPLMVAGGNALGGSFNVVANPNGGGPGVPLSIWSDKPVEGNGNWKTCHQGDFSNGDCSTSLSDSSHIGADIKQGDMDGFPKDLLFFLFNHHQDIPGWADMMNEAVASPPTSSCSSLSTESTGIFIVDGKCDLPRNVGSAGAPVVLIVRDGALALSSNLVFNGLIYAYSSDPAVPADVKANGTAVINGSLIANAPLKISNGTISVKYDQNVVNSIQLGAKFQASKMVPGSWRDW